MPKGKSPKPKKPEKKRTASPASLARARSLRLKAAEAVKSGGPLRRPAADAEGSKGRRRKKDEDEKPESQRSMLDLGKVIELKSGFPLPSDAFVKNDKMEIEVWYALDVVGEVLLRVIGLAAEGPEGPAYTVQPIKT